MHDFGYYMYMYTVRPWSVEMVIPGMLHVHVHRFILDRLWTACGARRENRLIAVTIIIRTKRARYEYAVRHGFLFSQQGTTAKI